MRHIFWIFHEDGECSSTLVMYQSWPKRIVFYILNVNQKNKFNVTFPSKFYWTFLYRPLKKNWELENIHFVCVSKNVFSFFCFPGEKIGLLVSHQLFCCWNRMNRENTVSNFCCCLLNLYMRNWNEKTKSW